MSNKYEIVLPERVRYSRRNKRFALISPGKETRVLDTTCTLSGARDREKENASAGRGLPTHVRTHM